MVSTVSLANLRFDEAFVSAIRGDKSVVKFTRAETGLLKYMVAHPNQVLSRNQLLDAASNSNEEKLDRSIDFLINRLRGKLKDNAKDPTFIATRYGEGYVWLATKSTQNFLARHCHAVIGPVFGLDHIGSNKGAAEQFSKRFYEDVQNHFSENVKVAFDPNCPKADQFDDGAPEIGIDLSFVGLEDQLECVIRGSMFRSGRTIFAKRVLVASCESTSKKIASVADEIAGILRKSLATEADSAVPLAVGMINAGKTFTGVKGHWSENAPVLRASVKDNPLDYHAKIMLATNIHTKYLQDSVQIFMSNDDPRKADEAEIEELVTTSLPHLQSDPAFLLPAAKLLFFVDQSYRDMAVEIAEQAQKECTSLAASLPVIGQMRVFSGRNEEGLAAINQALEICEAGTQFEAYLLILKCEALAAVADHGNIEKVLKKVCTQVPQIEMLMHVLFTNVDKPSKIAQQALVNMPPAQAKGMLMFMHYVYGRLLQNPDHRANAYRTPVKLFSKQFGHGIIPEEISILL